MIVDIARALGWAALLHMLSACSLAGLYLTLDGVVGTAVMICGGSPALDPLPTDITVWAQIGTVVQALVIVAAFGLITIALGWLTTRVFWRLAPCLHRIGLGAA